MSLSSVLPNALISSALSPHIPVVVASGSKKQMVGPNTGWRITPMQDTGSDRNGSNGHQPRSPVDQDGSLAAALVDLPISFSPPAPRPQPAGVCFVNQSPKSLDKRLSTFTALESLPKLEVSGMGTTATRIGTKLSVRRFVVTTFGAATSIGHRMYI